MSKEHLIIRSNEQLRAWLADRYGITLTKELRYENGKSYGCLNRMHGSSSGPIIWALNRCRDMGIMPPAGCPDDEHETTLFAQLDSTGSGIIIASPARSKISATNLVISPIDMTTLRVTTWCDIY